MPAVSKAQLRLMGGVCSGNIRSPGLSKETACEFVNATPKGAKLPERKKGRAKVKAKRA